MTNGTGGSIVVGVDGTEVSRRAVAWAGAFADAFGADVLCLTAWHNAMMWGDVVPKLDSEAAARRVVEEAVAAGRVEYPEVHFSTQVVGRSAADALVEASRGARLLVVGSRSQGRFKAILVGGSVATHCARRAGCPVTVVPGAGSMDFPGRYGDGREEASGAQGSKEGGR